MPDRGSTRADRSGLAVRAARGVQEEAAAAGAGCAGGRGVHPQAPTVAGRIRGEAPYLGEDERIHIADRLPEKATVRAITAELGRSPSTVSREIRRNRHPVSGDYRPHAAHRRARARRPRARNGKIATNLRLRDTWCRCRPSTVLKVLTAASSEPGGGGGAGPPWAGGVCVRTAGGDDRGRPRIAGTAHLTWWGEV